MADHWFGRSSGRSLAMGAIDIEPTVTTSALALRQCSRSARAVLSAISPLRRFVSFQKYLKVLCCSGYRALPAPPQATKGRKLEISEAAKK